MWPTFWYVEIGDWSSQTCITPVKMGAQTDHQFISWKEFIVGFTVLLLFVWEYEQLLGLQFSGSRWEVIHLLLTVFLNFLPNTFQRFHFQKFSTLLYVIICNFSFSSQDKSRCTFRYLYKLLSCCKSVSLIFFFPSKWRVCHHSSCNYFLFLLQINIIGPT